MVKLIGKQKNKEFLLFLLGTYGPQFFSYVHAVISDMNDYEFCAFLTITCAIVLINKFED